MILDCLLSSSPYLLLLLFLYSCGPDISSKSAITALSSLSPLSDTLNHPCLPLLRPNSCALVARAEEGGRREDLSVSGKGEQEGNEDDMHL